MRSEFFYFALLLKKKKRERIFVYFLRGGVTKRKYISVLKKIKSSILQLLHFSEFAFVWIFICLYSSFYTK